MIETTILNYLNDCLEYGVYTEIPEVKPERFYTIERTGGNVTNHIDEATIVIQSYAPSMYECAEMNETLKDQMELMVHLDDISRVYLNSDYNFTDPTTGQYRYQANYVVTYYK